MKIQAVLANPRGFCAGVNRAIEIVELALEKYGAPIYVRHEVVHNKFVVDNLRQKGVIFVDELDEIPEHSTVVFSAHGVSQVVWQEAEKRNLNIFDATCPLVTKVHIEVKQYRKKGLEVILIGHIDHPEVEGTMGQADGGIYLIENVEDIEAFEIQDADKLAYVSQTTLSIDDTARVVDALRTKFPNIQGPRKNDICYATQHRQDAVKKLAFQCDIVFVIGSSNSSNSNRLREIAELRGVSAYLVDGADEIQQKWLDGKSRVGITAGASAPESLVHLVLEKLNKNKMEVIELKGPKENISFSLPKGLSKTRGSS